MDDPSRLAQFADETFDIVISKEAILHIPIPYKKPFFAEIHRVLKPGGELIVMDWMHAGPKYSEKTQKMIEMDGIAYHLVAPIEYRELLQESGFLQIEMENISAETAQFSQENIDKIGELAPAIREKYGQEVYDYCIETWSYQRDAFASEELITTIFRAKKRL